MDPGLRQDDDEAKWILAFARMTNEPATCRRCRSCCSTPRGGTIPLRALFAACLAFAAIAAVAAYPERPIRLIVSSPAGASSDVVTRILAAELVSQMGQQIIVDNRPGAVQTIGTGLIVRANPDGYTIGYANVVTLAINRAMISLPYDTDR